MGKVPAPPPLKKTCPFKKGGGPNYDYCSFLGSNKFLNMSWEVSIWKERINGNFEEIDGVAPSKWVNEKE